MVDMDSMVPLVIAITIGAVFFIPVVDIVDSTSGEVIIDDETVTTNATQGETYDLEGYDLVADNETIEYDNGSGFQTATEGSDYSIDETNGTITVLSGGSISAGNEVRASYSYNATSGTVTTITDLLPLFMALLLLVPMASRIQKGV